MRNSSKTKVIICLLSFALVVDSSLAYEEIPIGYFFDELPVVLSATRLSQSLKDTPAAITIIDKEMIRATGARNIPDLLRLVPGFNIGSVSGHRSTVTYHGLADQYSRDMQVLIDGRSVYEPAFGGVSWFYLPINVEEIARIEVTRGPNAASYGFNSFSGIINIITEHPLDVLGTLVKATAGSDHNQDIYFRHSDQIADFSYLFSGNVIEQTGFGNREDDGLTKWINFSGSQLFENGDTLDLRFGYSRGTYQEGWEDDFDLVRDLESYYHYQQLNWRHQVSETNEVKIQFYHNRQKSDDIGRTPILSDMIRQLDEMQAFPEDSRPDLFASLVSGGNYTTYQQFLDATRLTDTPIILSINEVRMDRYDLEVQQTLQLDTDLRLVWGGSVRHDRADSVWIFHTYDTISRNLARLFANAEWQISPDWVVNAGGMAEKLENKDTTYSPRLALNYHATENHTLRAIGTRSYRMPVLVEDFANIVYFQNEPLNDLNIGMIATENLEPEKIDSLELGYLGQLFDERLILDVKLFREEIENRIINIENLDYPDPDRGLTDPIALLTLNNFNDVIQEGAYTFRNNGEAVVRGIEINLDFRPTPRDIVFMGYSHMDAEGFLLDEIENGQADYDFDISERVSRHTFSLLGSHTFENQLQVSLAYYYVDDLEWGGEGDYIPAYDRWDARISKAFKLQNADAELAIIGQNLGGSHSDFFNSGSGRKNIAEERIFIEGSVSF